jgi:RNA polymerase sigma-70 factor (ECF subfamily)
LPDAYRFSVSIACVSAIADTRRAMTDEGEASDEALMAAYRDGDAAAFERLYRRHRGGLYRFLLRQCGGAAVAEELFQDVWMNLIRARERYVPQARFATYLYHVAHNRLIDHFRRSTHRPSLPEIDDDEADPVERIAADPREQPEAKLETKARIERFSQLLSALPAAQREAFVMHEEGGLNVDEIAEATGVNAETAKSRLRYAVAKLRRGLQELM